MVLQLSSSLIIIIIIINFICNALFRSLFRRISERQVFSSSLCFSIWNINISSSQKEFGLFSYCLVEYKCFLSFKIKQKWFGLLSHCFSGWLKMSLYCQTTIDHTMTQSSLPFASWCGKLPCSHSLTVKLTASLAPCVLWLTSDNNVFHTASWMKEWLDICEPWQLDI